MNICNICPRLCNIDRNLENGNCKTKWDPVVSSVMVHRGEEPPISGSRGSGTVFFSGCNLGCVFCQNHDISQTGSGTTVTIDEMVDIFHSLEAKGVHNINLVTPSHFVPPIAEAIKRSKERGVKIPFVYNSGGYDATHSLKLMEGLIDIYMPDMKYGSDVLGQRYSNVPDYFTVATQALKDMYRQVGAPEYERGIMQKGLFVRHLVLPGQSGDSTAVLDWIKQNIPLAGVSLMAQYSPQYNANEYEEINRRLTSGEYRKVESHFKSIGLNEVYMQRIHN